MREDIRIKRTELRPTCVSGDAPAAPSRAEAPFENHAESVVAAEHRPHDRWQHTTTRQENQKISDPPGLAGAATGVTCGCNEPLASPRLKSAAARDPSQAVSFPDKWRTPSLATEFASNSAEAGVPTTPNYFGKADADTLELEVHAGLGLQ